MGRKQQITEQIEETPAYGGFQRKKTDRAAAETEFPIHAAVPAVLPDGAGAEKDTGRSESGGDTGGAEDEVQAMY